MNKQTYLAVATQQPQPKIKIIAPENAVTPTSNWAIVAAIMIAAMPHLWQWVSGHQKARNSLTE